MSCCGCLETPSRVTNLYRHEELLYKFTDLTGLSIIGNTFICDCCSAQLEASFAFKEKCIEIYKKEIIEDEAMEQSDENIFADELIYEVEEWLEDDAVKTETVDEQFEILSSDLIEAEKSPAKCRKTYNAEEKLEAIKNAEESGNRQAARILSIDESCIRQWRQNKEHIESKLRNQTITKPEPVDESGAVCDLLGTSSLVAKDEQNPKSAKNRKSYTSGQKLEAVKLAEQTSNRQAAKVFLIDESCIRKWRHSKKLLIEIHNERGTKRKPNLHWPDIDSQLKAWAIAQLSAGIRLKPSQIKAQSIEIAKRLKITNFRGTSSYIFKFMERYHIPGRSKKTPSTRVIETIE